MNYKVLARKYRPQSFNEIVGQDTLVETFKNAINHGRLAHSFLLTGIRGVGKTTTARIIAKSFNCEGNQNQGPTFNVCNKCKPCETITKGNCLDVLEIDAASKTGVDNIREIIDSVMYAPNETRFKIYIIDEVHMLSVQAFNALLKTLEEPPDSSKFIFATTEIRKIPATIISRCQRFDLKRIDNDEQIKHLKQIAENEKIEIDQLSLNQIADSSEGSMRDALSILDQAAALMNNDVKIDILKEMLGLKGYNEYFKLLSLCLKSDSILALKKYDSFIELGVPPIQIISNLMEICTKSSRYTIGEFRDNSKENENTDLLEISNYGISHLIRSWQVLVRGFEETKNSANQIDSASMVILKLCYSSKLPMPEEIIKKLNNNSFLEKNNKEISTEKDLSLKTKEEHNESKSFEDVKQDKKIIENESEEKLPKSLNELLNLLIDNKEAYLHAQIINNVYIIAFKPGEIKLELNENCDDKFLNTLSSALENITKVKWKIIESKSELKKTISEEKENEFDNKKSEILEEPLLKEILNEFPEAEIKNIEDK